MFLVINIGRISLNCWILWLSNKKESIHWTAAAVLEHMEIRPGALVPVVAIYVNSHVSPFLTLRKPADFIRVITAI